MDTLLDVPESPLSRLQVARLRHESATAAFEKARELEDESGEPILSSVSREYYLSMDELERAERAEIRRLKA